MTAHASTVARWWVWAALLSLGCSSGANGKPVMLPGDTPAVAKGRAIYGQYCALCHGKRAEGYLADNASALGNAQFLTSVSDTFLYVAIDRGRPATPMAAYGKRSGGPLGSPEINALVAFLRSLQHGPEVNVKKQIIEGDASRAMPLYTQRCSRCHGARGEGKIAISLNNPMFLATASNGFIRYAIEKGRGGTAMAAYGDQLSAQQLDDLTQLIRSWATNIPAPPVPEGPPQVDHIIINPGGPAPHFPPLREGRYLPAEAVKEALASGARLVLLDARPTSDWLLSHIPGALPVPYYNATKMVAALPRDGTWIISYCGCPHAASGRVMDALRERGFDKTAVIDEGIFEWLRRGYPITTGSRRP